MKSKIYSEDRLWALFKKRPTPALRRKLAELHQGVVEDVLKGFCRDRNVSHDELRSAGHLALLTQIDKFDPTRGCKFTTFARYRIYGAMLDDIRKQHGRRCSGHGMPERVARAEAELTQQFGRPPSDDEVTEYLGITYQQVLHARRKQVAWDVPHNDDRSDDSSRNPPWDVDKSLKNTGEQLDHLLAKLPARETTLVYLRYTLSLTQQELAAIFGKSPQWVQARLAAALDMLRQSLAAG